MALLPKRIRHNAIPLISTGAMIAVITIYTIFDAQTLGLDLIRTWICAVIMLAAWFGTQRLIAQETHVPSEISSPLWLQSHTRHDLSKTHPFAIGLLVFIAGVAGCVIAWRSLGDVPLSASAALSRLGVIAFSCIGTAIWEEICFRGLLIRALQHNYPSLKMYVLISSILFALLHLSTTASIGWNAVRFIQVFLFGIAMCGLASYGQRLVTAISAHALFDICVFAPFAIRAASDTPSAWDMPLSIFAAAFEQPSMLVVTTILLLPAALLALWHLKPASK